MLPPALRPSFRNGSVLHTSDLNLHYQRIINRVRRLATLLELRAPESILENERHQLEMVLCALMVDGVTVFAGERSDEDSEDDPPPEDFVSDPSEVEWRMETGEVPLRRLISLHDHLLDRQPSRFFRWLDAELAGNPRVLSAHLWPPDAHEWRAYLEAAGLEIVPLTQDGRPDLELLEQARLDRGVRIASEVHRLCFTGGLEVFHVPDEPGRVAGPHVDVHAYREGGELLLVTSTIGLTEQPQVEFVCIVTDVNDEPTRLALMRKLWWLATYSSASGRRLAARHSVDLEEPLAGESALTGFVFLDGSGLRFASTLRALLPSHPEILLAVGVTGAELEHRIRHGAARLLEAAETTLAGKTILHRESSIV